MTRISGFDAMRGVCALVVVILHTSFLTKVVVAPSAYLMVDLFFAMSGYVIALVYEGRLTEGGFFREFVARRWARLIPMFAIGLVIGVGSALLAHHHAYYAATTLFGLLLGLAFLPSSTKGFLFTNNAPGWSLFFEAVANVAYAAVAQRLTTRVLLGLLAAGALGIILTAKIAGTLDTGMEWSNFAGGLVRVTFSFTLGILCFRLQPRVPMIYVPPVAFWLWMAGLFLLAFANPHGLNRQIFDVAFILIGCPVFLLVGLAGSVGAPKISGLMGEVSYPIYATHFPIMVLASRLHGASTGWKGGSVPGSVVLATLVAVVAVALACMALLDRWQVTRRLTKRLLSKAASGKTSAAAAL